MRCPECGVEPFEIFPGEFDCICGPEEPERPPYINHCWNCFGPIDSRVCKPSPRNQGYICNICKCDLAGEVNVGNLSEDLEVGSPQVAVSTGD